MKSRVRFFGGIPRYGLVLELRSFGVKIPPFNYGSYGDGMDGDQLARQKYLLTNQLKELLANSPTADHIDSLRRNEAMQRSQYPENNVLPDLGVSYATFLNQFLVDQSNALRKINLPVALGDRFERAEVRRALFNIYNNSRWATATTLWLADGNFPDFGSKELYALRDQAAIHLEDPEIRQALLVDPGMMLLALGANGITPDFESSEEKDGTNLQLKDKEADFKNKQIDQLKISRSQKLVKFAEETMRPLLMKYKLEYRRLSDTPQRTAAQQNSLEFGNNPNTWNDLGRKAILNLKARIPQLLYLDPQVFNPNRSTSQISCKDLFLM